jgi:hypothetical protein
VEKEISKKSRKVFVWSVLSLLFGLQPRRCSPTFWGDYPPAEEVKWAGWSGPTGADSPPMAVDGLLNQKSTIGVHQSSIDQVD